MLFLQNNEILLVVIRLLLYIDVYLLLFDDNLIDQSKMLMNEYCGM